MKQDNKNSISIIQRNLDDALRVNPIEDGNAPMNNTNQGYIYTSEIINSDYTDSYLFNVKSIFSKKNVTGNDNYYQVLLSYKANDENFNSAWFGNNLIKVGDPFTLKNAASINFNYVKGSVISIENITVNSTLTPTITYEYTLSCSIAEGLSSDLPQGMVPTGAIDFLTNRRIFKEINDKAPTNLLSSIRNNTAEFSWEDPDSKAIGYHFTYRTENNSYTSEIFYLYGNTWNFNGKVKAKIDGNGITTVKILDNGKDLAFPVITPNVILSSNAVVVPVIQFWNDGLGHLAIDDFKIVAINSTGSNTINCSIQPIGRPTWGSAIGNRTFIDFSENTFLGDARITSNPIQFGNDFLAVTIEYESSFTYPNIAIAENDLIGKIIKAHTGVKILNSGAGIVKEPIIQCDKYNENTKNVFTTSSFVSVPNTYYWKVASIFEYNQKSFSEWSTEEKIIVS